MTDMLGLIPEPFYVTEFGSGRRHRVPGIDLDLEAAIDRLENALGGKLH